MFDSSRRSIISLVAAPVSDERRRSAHLLIFQVPPHHSTPASAPLAEGSGADHFQVCSPGLQMSTWVCTFVPYRRALSGGRCRGSSATTFQLVFITDRQPQPTVYRRRPSFSGRRCSCLEQSAWTCHFRTFCGCLPVPSQDTPVWHIISRPRVIVQCLRSDVCCFRTL